ncbi:alpha/beta fold hydrolase [Microbispora sp. NPDC049125]|uniref:alpha/beta fold hydrolase n=1 Tax=Microbispora sp. NPDC049125 TaxID=3154929 RepID=UPI003466E5F5
MSRVTSEDGTPIAYERLGNGPAVILVGGGGAVDRSENSPLAVALGEHFTVYNFDRRGRGESGDTQPYAVEREFEDIAALIEHAGGPAHLYGVSSGGALVLEAAAAGLPIDEIGVYEVPYDVSPGVQERHREYTEKLGALLAQDRLDDAFELFMRLAGSSDDDVRGARSSPMWPELIANARTLAYDAACLNDGSPPVDRLAKVSQPVLVATGGMPDPNMGGLAPGFFDHAADAVAEVLPRAERVVIESQGHVADPKAVVPVLKRFFES